MTDNEFLLQDRIQKIQQIINQYGEENFYISFSGGKDSTVLSKLIDMALPDNNIPRVYADTGIELNMIRNFVYKLAEDDWRIEIIKPSQNIRDILEFYGYPFKSKHHSRYVDIFRRKGVTKSIKQYTTPFGVGKETYGAYNCPKKLMYQFESNYNGIKISDKCCEKLKEKPKVIIGGAARLLELIHLKKLKVNAVKSLVLDEADRLLSPELRSDTERLLERLPKTIQIIGNSATVSPYTCKTLQNLKFSQKELDFISLPPENILKEKITHWAIFSERRNKIDTLRSFINAEKPQKLIVFSSKTDQVKIIKEKLAFKGIECGLLSAKENKVDRKTTIDRFRSGKIKVLITTDLASRGLDIPNISHVVQMDLPEESDFFVHRAGRTARAGNTGINCVIGDAIEMQNYAKLEKKLKIIVYPKILYKGVVCTPESLS